MQDARNELPESADSLDRPNAAVAIAVPNETRVEARPADPPTVFNQSAPPASPAAHSHPSPRPAVGIAPAASPGHGAARSSLPVITDMGDTSSAVKFLQAGIAAVIAVFCSVLAVHAAQGRAINPLPEIALTRIAGAWSGWPTFQGVVHAVMVLEWGLAAILAMLAAIAFLKETSPPRGDESEHTVFRSRQVRQFRWALAAKGALFVFGASALMTAVHPHLESGISAAEGAWNGIRGVAGWPPLPPHAPTIMAVLHPMLLGLLETIGMQWIIRFVWSAAILFSRAFMVVIVDSYGMCNRIVLGDGQFRNRAFITIPRERLVSANPISSRFAQTVFCLVPIQIIYRDEFNNLQTIIINGPSTVENTMTVCEFLNSIRFRALDPLIKTQLAYNAAMIGAIGRQSSTAQTQLMQLAAMAQQRQRQNR